MLLESLQCRRQWQQVQENSNSKFDPKNIGTSQARSNDRQSFSHSMIWYTKWSVLGPGIEVILKVSLMTQGEYPSTGTTFCTSNKNKYLSFEKLNLKCRIERATNEIHGIGTVSTIRYSVSWSSQSWKISKEEVIGQSFHSLISSKPTGKAQRFQWLKEQIHPRGQSQHQCSTQIHPNVQADLSSGHWVQGLPISELRMQS